MTHDNGTKNVLYIHVCTNIHMPYMRIIYCTGRACLQVVFLHHYICFIHKSHTVYSLSLFIPSLKLCHGKSCMTS